jgi:phosphoribosylformylglycinamidine cyclo-ligase
VLCTDGVGSKVIIANELRKWDTVGIDCIAMNVNDAICVGAEPLAFVDYLAINNPDPSITKQIGIGLEKGATLSNISIIGGETASLPDLIDGFDLAGTCLGYAKKDKIILGESIQPSDVMIGLKSTGIHSNGFSLIRKVIDQSSYTYHDTFPGKEYPHKSIGEVLLTPTQIYVKEIVALLQEVSVHGLAHITGSGLRNLPRLKPTVKFVVTDPIDTQPIFTFIQTEGNIETYEMYKTFNMGMGFCVIVDKNDVDDTLNILKKYSSVEVKVVGEIQSGSGVEVPPLNLKY